jgi:GDP/UDP-N,N'-diacetylbacillosamine 2-epimerase (hydrolysing)
VKYNPKVNRVVSSGLTEAPSFRKGTVNIGDRQRGRLKATSVINCAPNKTDIEQAIKFLYSDAFQKDLVSTVNPYGQGGASEKIVQTLENSNFIGLPKKHFYTLAVSE